jgi:hypothetical protein
MFALTDQAGFEALIASPHCVVVRYGALEARVLHDAALAAHWARQEGRVETASVEQSPEAERWFGARVPLTLACRTSSGTLVAGYYWVDGGAAVRFVSFREAGLRLAVIAGLESLGDRRPITDAWRLLYSVLEHSETLPMIREHVPPPAPMSDHEDWIARGALGVEVGAGRDEIEKAYRREMSKCHPDRWATRRELVPLAEAHAKSLNEARSRLLRST